MQMQSLFLRNFRSYQEAFVEFHPQLNLIHGLNARGKTSILEAIYCLALGRSFRSRHYQDLIKHGEQAFQVEGRFLKHGVEQTLRFLADAEEKRIYHNQNLLPTLSSLVGIVQGVVSAPDDINLIKGAPALRRQYLDLQLSQSDVLYFQNLSRYNKALRQRNSLLKAGGDQAMSSWEQQMAHAAAYLITQRQRALQQLEKSVESYYEALSGESAPLHLLYKNDLEAQITDNLVDKLLHRFEKQRPKELIAGHTLSGPHRDDFIILLNGKEAKLFASEGQQRSCIQAMRFGEWRRLTEAGNQAPIFMIDDIAMSLDDQRRSRLIDQLAQMGQVFLTTTDAELFPMTPSQGQKIALPLEMAGVLGAI